MWFVLLKQVCVFMVLVCSCTVDTATVTDSTQLRFDPTNQSVLEGNNGTLTCNISKSKPGVYYIHRNDELSYVYHPQVNCKVIGPLTKTQEYDVTCINEDVQITIVNVSRDRHNEAWSCRRNIDEIVYESNSTISVRVPITNVRIETHGEYIITKENTPTKIVCVTSAGYPKAATRWYNNNKELTNGDVTTSSTTYNTYLKVVRSTLTLHLTRADNSSKIHCAAKNNGTTWQYSKKTSVIVYYAPGVTNITKGTDLVNEEFKVKAGNAVDVTCSSSSFPEPNYSWIPPNGANITGRRLLITKISRTGGGSYTCKATNTMALSSGAMYQGENTTTFNVLVLYPPSQPMFKYRKTNNNMQFNMRDKSLHVVRNDSFNLTCTTDSQPPSKYQWTWTGYHTFQDTNTENLTLVSIQEDLSLTCTATNIIAVTFEASSSHTATSTISINVQFPPSTPVVSIQKTPIGAPTLSNIITVNIIQGDSVKITCTADSKPEPHSYNWTGPINGVDNTLLLPNMTEQHKGNYSCTAKNNMNRTFGDDPVGINTRRLEIDILYPPRQPEFYFNNRSDQSILNNTWRVIKDTTFDVECVSIGNPVPYTFSWNYSSVNDRQVVGVKNILNDVSLTCTVTNTMIDSFGESRDGTANATLAITVLYQPQGIELKVNNINGTGRNDTAYVKEGDNVTLTCNANSEPPPSTYRWYKLPSTTSPTVAKREYSIYRINRTHAGQYKCLVENVMYPSFGKQESGTISKNLSLEVLYPTRIVMFIVDGYTAVDVTVNEKDNITLVCKVDGKPESNVSFLHEDTHLEHATVMNNINHTITNVACVQHGQYACAAKNMYNTERPMKYLTLFVRCSPRPKPNSELQEVFASALNVDTTISFEVLAYPAPTKGGFKWEKEIKNGSSWKEVENNDKILVSSYGVQSNLTLKNISRSSFGNYRLNVTNKIGTYTHQFVLQAEATPTVKPIDENRIIPAVSGVAASVVAICVIVVIIVLYKRRQNQKDSSKKHHGATTPNVSRGVYEIGPSETVFSHRNNDAYTEGTDNKSKVYQNVADLHLTRSATSSKQSSSKAQPAAAPSKMIYQNLPGFNTKKKAPKKTKIKPKVVERSSPLSLLEPDDSEVHCDGQNNDFVYGNVGRRIERVQVAELLTYVTNKSYEPEYAGFLKGLQFPTTVAMKPENIKLNRYQGIFPYDLSRVTIPDDPNFFMNACYINGYNREKAYIASLGPTSDTTNGYRTFWKMVWHEQTDIIVMVTNLREITGMKCQQYWPELGTSITYGDVTVTCQAVTVSAEYTVRVFSVSKSGVFRTLHQLHFTAWPDKGVPDDVTSLLEFRNRIKSTSTMGTGPIIVHCSAGIGRTGTLIALDILIDEGTADGSVNVSACVKRLREQRVNMVQTAEQYAFVHKALVYTLAFECETIHSETFQEYLESSTDLFFESMLKQLQPNVSRDAEAEARKSNEKYTKINRPGAEIPGDKHSVKLYLNKDSDDVDYINAVYINSFKKKNHFISAQTPRIASEEDFLNLIFQEGCMCIVTFDQSEAHGNERDIGVYLPPENQNLTIGNFKVSCSRLETKPQYIVRRMKVENHGKFDSGEKISYHFQYTRWESDKRMPDDPSEFAQFIKDIDQYLKELSESDVHVLAHCMDASERSGLFCSIATMIEKIECEGRVNVGNTIRQIRNRRMTAIQNMEQLRFCHQAVNAYINMKTPQ